MEGSKIQWTDHTFNAWIGCHKVSPACKHCYAAVDTFARRMRANGLELWGEDAARHVTSPDYWKQPLKWNRDAAAAGKRARVFCSSLADVFEGREDLDAPRAWLFYLIEQTPHLDWLLLTKRPEWIHRLVPPAWMAGAWPANAWAGTTVEDQQHAERRIPWLMEVPAPVRFLSIEPQLGSVDLENIRPYYLGERKSEFEPIVLVDCLRGHVKGPDDLVPEQRVHWVICGGESGTGAREFDIAWARSIVRQCRGAGTPVFVKQLGARPVDSARADILGTLGNVRYVRDAGSPDVAEVLRSEGAASVRAHLVTLDDRKGGDMGEWPEDLRVREFPAPRST